MIYYILAKRGSTVASSLRIWYDRPASGWQQGLPIGNGRLGAVVYGGIGAETWSLSETTFWSGRPEPLDPPSNTKADLTRMRNEFFAGDFERGEAEARARLQPTKRNFGTNLPLCRMELTFDSAGEGVTRELDLERAVVSTTYSNGGARFRREAFASHVDGVLASRFLCDRPGGVSFELRIEGDDYVRVLGASAGDGTIRFEAQALETMHSDGRCGVRCAGAVRLAVRGGAVRENEGGGLLVSGADEAVVYVAVATDYGATEGEDWRSACDSALSQAIRKGYEQAKADHVCDYRALFSRVTLSLGDGGQPSLPTDERVRRIGSGPEDPALYALFYQYARYLTISGSREDSPLPMNLQGIWNDGEANRMQWSCDYHLDVNTQMNYYPVETGHLGECHAPLMRFVERLAASSGRAAARHFYDSDGWVAHVFTNAWGFASPGWETSWGLNVTGGLWIAAHLMERYTFGRDDAFLARTAYPVLKEAAAFFLDYMTIHPEFGWLVTGPSNSPENSFYTGDDRVRSHALSMGPTMDQMLVRELFEFCIEASERLDADAALRERLREAAEALPPLRVGARGQLQEWLEDYAEAQPDHRHLSHLYGLFPGNQVTPFGTPALAAAARKTLELRMSRAELEDVEFTLALFAACFARLRDGDAAHRQLSDLIGKLCFDNLFTFSKAGIAGAETNIFVIDGNFGGAAAIAELLLQSHAGELDLLPALPKRWPTGRVAGLRARGDVEVDLVWEGGALAEATLRAGTAGRTTVRYGERTLSLELQPGMTFRFGPDLTPLPG